MYSRSEHPSAGRYETVHVVIGGDGGDPAMLALAAPDAEVFRFAGERHEARRLLEIVAMSNQVVYWPWTNGES